MILYTILYTILDRCFCMILPVDPSAGPPHNLFGRRHLGNQPKSGISRVGTLALDGNGVAASGTSNNLSEVALAFLSGWLREFHGLGMSWFWVTINVACVHSGGSMMTDDYCDSDDC